MNCLSTEGDAKVNYHIFVGNGSVYTWGAGMDGQLGHGEQIRFLEYPKRVKDRHIAGKAIQIGSGETYSAAVTGKLARKLFLLDHLCFALKL